MEVTGIERRENGRHIHVTFHFRGVVSLDKSMFIQVKLTHRNNGLYDVEIEKGRREFPILVSDIRLRDNVWISNAGTQRYTEH